jgi:glycosyltransferase involved in cell wall biosynthesis
VFQNRDDQEFFLAWRLLTGARHSVIPGSGIDVACFDDDLSNGPSSEAVRRDLGLGDAPTVMTVARITREKGIGTLLEAAAILHRDAPRVRFLLVGPRESEGQRGISDSELNRHAAYVRAIGPRSDIPSLLRVADVFAFPTELREGVPRALMEACLAGVPAVATGLPGCVDVIRHEWSGLIVPPRCPGALATAVLDLLRDRDTASVYASRASRHVRRRMSLDIVADGYASVYEEVLTRSREAACVARELHPAALRTAPDTTLPRDL